VEHSVGRLTVRCAKFGRDQVVTNVEHSRACVQHNNHHNELVDYLRKNGAPHYRGNEAVVLLDAIGRKILLRSFSSKGNSGENVHDQVNPEKLNDVEGRHSGADATQDDNGHAAEVHSELELKELADIVNNVATPFHGLSNRSEVVVKDNDVSLVFCSSASGSAHGETDSCLLKGEGIVEAITSDTTSRPRQTHASNEQVFVLRVAAIENLDLLLDILSEFLLSVLTDKLIGLDIIDKNLTGKRSNSFSELLTRHAASNLTFLNDRDQFGNTEGSLFVIT